MPRKQKELKVPCFSCTTMHKESELIEMSGQLICPSCGEGWVMLDQRDSYVEVDLLEALEELKREFESLVVPLTKENKMAKSKPAVKTISDKLVKVNENFTINMYDNGFMIEVGGRDHENEWKTAKIMVTTVDELVALVREAAEMERDS